MPYPEPRPGGPPVARLSAYWRDLYEERAAILQYDGGHTRERAEWRAFDEVRTMIKAEREKK